MPDGSGRLTVNLKVLVDLTASEIVENFVIGIGVLHIVVILFAFNAMVLLSNCAPSPIFLIEKARSFILFQDFGRMTRLTGVRCNIFSPQSRRLVLLRDLKLNL